MSCGGTKSKGKRETEKQIRNRQRVHFIISLTLRNDRIDH